MINNRKNIPFGSQLTLAFGVIIVVFLLVLSIINFKTRDLTITANTIEQTRFPTAYVSQTLTGAVQKSLASLRAWMLLGDPKYKLERINTWQQEITPALERMDQLSQQWSNKENTTQFNKVKIQLNEFSIIQQRIETIANTLEATPARKILVNKATPLAQHINEQITTIIESETLLSATPQRKALFKAMADFRGSLAASMIDIRHYIQSGDPSLTDSFAINWATNQRSIDYLITHQTLLSESQKVIFNKLKQDRQLLSPLPLQIFNIRQTKRHDQANYLLTHEAIPKAENILSLLKQLGDDQSDLLEQDFVHHQAQLNQLINTSTLSITIGVMLIMTLGVFISKSLKSINLQTAQRNLDIENTQKKLQQANHNLTEQNALKAQVAKINELSQKSTKLTNLCDDIITALATFLNASQGMIYLLNPQKDSNEQTDDKELLILHGSYALTAEQQNKTKFKLGEALVGQCAVDKQVKLLTEIPAGYMNIGSGLGHHNPVSLLLVPIIFEQQLKGVIELASLNVISTKQKESVMRLIPSIAAGINNQFYVEQIHFLLEQTQQQSKTLEEKTHHLEEKNKAIEHKNIEIEKSQILLAQRAQELERSSGYKSNFLATMSHEIRTPMNGVLGMLGLLLESKLSKSQLKNARMAYSSANSLLSIINDILDFSKVDAGKLELEVIELDLLQLFGEISETMALKAQEKNIELILNTVHLKHQHVKGDPSRIRQILTNLIANAIKFTTSGRVLVIANTLMNNNDEVILHCQVDDTGIGIAEHQKQSLFDPFNQADTSTTRNYGGTGLGLSIVKKLLNLMQGDIYIRAKSGPGSCFAFDLTLLPAELTCDPSIDLNNKHLLVVEEACCARQVLCEQFRHWNANVDAMTVSELLTKTMDTDDPKYSLILIDNNANDETETDLATVIRDIPEYDQTKLVAMVPMNFETETLTATSQEFDAFIFKPIIHSDLIDVIKLISDENNTASSGLENQEQTATEKIPSDSKRVKDRVLLVEDNHINQQVAKALLENLDLHCDIATNGQEAIDTLLLTPKTSPYHAIIMDCQMPIMDGYTATKLIRQGKASQAYQDIPIIALTANALTTDRETCINAGMNDYLSKPIKADVLGQMLKKWL